MRDDKPKEPKIDLGWLNTEQPRLRVEVSPKYPDVVVVLPADAPRATWKPKRFKP